MTFIHMHKACAEKNILLPYPITDGRYFNREWSRQAAALLVTNSTANNSLAAGNANEISIRTRRSTTRSTSTSVVSLLPSWSGRLLYRIKAQFEKGFQMQREVASPTNTDGRLSIGHTSRHQRDVASPTNTDGRLPIGHASRHLLSVSGRRHGIRQAHV
jgi:hypothetical protein